MLKVVLDNPAVVENGTELEAVVDADLAKFDEWLQERQRQAQREQGVANPEVQPIVRSERAILKTYLWWKTKGT